MNAGSPACRAQDAEAFGRFYRRHEHQVLGCMIARCSNPGEVADAVGETFLAALGAAARFATTAAMRVPGYTA